MKQKDWPRLMLESIWRAVKVAPVRIQYDGCPTPFCIDAYKNHIHIEDQSSSTSFCKEIVEALRIMEETYKKGE